MWSLNHINYKQSKRDEISQDVESFFKKGGRVTVVPFGIGSEKLASFNSELKKMPASTQEDIDDMRALTNLIKGEFE